MTPPTASTQRRYNIDKRSCNDPEQGWKPVARDVLIDEMLQLLRNGLHLPEATPHVYRAWNIFDDPGA